MMKNQQCLTPPLLRITIRHVGISTHEYNTHSFWIGATTSTKVAGISDLHIKCWVDGKLIIT